MSKFIPLNSNNASDERYMFQCPGCEYAHFIQVNPSTKPCWTWNGDVNNPTVQPSIFTRAALRCHSFIRDGNIQFLDDCDHKLKGQTVPLPDWDTV